MSDAFIVHPTEGSAQTPLYYPMSMSIANQKLYSKCFSVNKSHSIEKTGKRIYFPKIRSKIYWHPGM